jgi:hypothetical protein
LAPQITPQLLMWLQLIAQPLPHDDEHVGTSLHSVVQLSLHTVPQAVPTL